MGVRVAGAGHFHLCSASRTFPTNKVKQMQQRTCALLHQFQDPNQSFHFCQSYFWPPMKRIISPDQFTPFGRRVSWYGGINISPGLCPAAPLPRCEIAPNVKNGLPQSQVPWRMLMLITLEWARFEVDLRSRYGRRIRNNSGIPQN